MAEKNPDLAKQHGGKGMAIKGAVTKTDTDLIRGDSRNLRTEEGDMREIEELRRRRDFDVTYRHDKDKP